MKVLLFTIVPSPYQRDLFGAMADLPGIDLRVVYCEAASPDSPWPRHKPASYESILPGRWIGGAGARWHLHRSLPQVNDADLVVMNALMGNAAQRLMRHSLNGKKWIFWGEQLRAQAVGWRRAAQAFLTSPLCKASCIAAIGSRAAQDYALRFPDIPVRDMPYFCDLSGFVTAGHRAMGEPGTVFLFAGQMIPRKGVDILLHAFSQVVSEGADARLRLVGREADLPVFLRSLDQPVLDRIEYAGFHAPLDLPAEFARANVFVLPSRHDGWGVVVNQAIGAGLPVICSDTVGAGEDLVDPDVNGWIVPAGDAGALAERMRKATREPETIARFTAASKRMAADWTPQAGASRFHAIFQEVLSS